MLHSGIQDVIGLDVSRQIILASFSQQEQAFDMRKIGSFASVSDVMPFPRQSFPYTWFAPDRTRASGIA